MRRRVALAAPAVAVSVALLVGCGAEVAVADQQPSDGVVVTSQSEGIYIYRDPMGCDYVVVDSGYKGGVAITPRLGTDRQPMCGNP